LHRKETKYIFAVQFKSNTARSLGLKIVTFRDINPNKIGLSSWGLI